MKEESLLKWTINTIKRFGIRPRQEIGQNYVVDPNVIECLIEAARIGSDEVVLEVGAGIGALTVKLAEIAKNVIAVEMDENSIRALSKTLSGIDNVNIVMGDVMNINLPKVDKVVSNLPFSISTPFTFKLLREGSFKLAVLTYQKEVAERMLARPGEGDYSRLSVVTALLADVERVRDFPPEAFYPKPKVSSTVIAIRKKNFDMVDWIDLEDLLKILFSQRRRKLKKAIDSYCKIKDLDKTELISRIDEKMLMKRVFELEPKDFLYLGRVMGGKHVQPKYHG